MRRTLPTLMLFLASDEARFITAEIVNIDGGAAAKLISGFRGTRHLARGRRPASSE